MAKTIVLFSFLLKELLLYEILGTEVSLFSAFFAYLMCGVNNKAAVSTRASCHLSLVTFKLLTDSLQRNFFLRAWRRFTTDYQLVHRVSKLPSLLEI